MKDETSHNTSFAFKTAISFNWQIIAVEGANLLAKKLHHEIMSICRSNWKPCILFMKIESFSCLWCWCRGLSSRLSGSINKCVFCFWDSRNYLSNVSLFYANGLTTYVFTYIAGLVMQIMLFYQLPAITWSQREVDCPFMQPFFLTPLACFCRLSKKCLLNKMLINSFTYSSAFHFYGLASYFHIHFLANGRMMAQEILKYNILQNAFFMFFPKSSGRSSWANGGTTPSWGWLMSLGPWFLVWQPVKHFAWIGLLFI